jgi:hypothetical protein
MITGFVLAAAGAALLAVAAVGYLVAIGLTLVISAKRVSG